MVLTREEGSEHVLVGLNNMCCQSGSDNRCAVWISTGVFIRGSFWRSGENNTGSQAACECEKSTQQLGLDTESPQRSSVKKRGREVEAQLCIDRHREACRGGEFDNRCCAGKPYPTPSQARAEKELAVCPSCDWLQWSHNQYRQGSRPEQIAPALSSRVEQSFSPPLTKLPHFFGGADACEFDVNHQLPS